MKQRWLFIIPDDYELLLGIICVIQHHITAKQAKGIEPEVTLSCPDTWYRWLPQVIPGALVVYDHSIYTRSAFDLVVEFNAKDIRDIAVTTKKSMVQTVGLIVGEDPRVNFPNLTDIVKSYQVEDKILFIPWRWRIRQGVNASIDAEMAKRAAAHFCPHKQVDVMVDASFETTIATVACYKYVIGELGVATFVAAALGKYVIAFCAEDGHPEWFDLRRSRFSRTILTNTAMVPGDVGIQLMETLCQTLEAPLPKESTPTVQ